MPRARPAYSFVACLAIVGAICFPLAVGASGPADTAAVRRLGFDTAGQWKQWEQVSFPNTALTEYEFNSDSGEVCASADASASGLGIRFPGQLEDYPELSWEWKLVNSLESADGREKESDDFAARVYVTFERDSRLSYWERFKAGVFESFYGQNIPGRALNFTWANKLEAGQIVASPYTDNSRVVVLRSGDAEAGEWRRERVDLRSWYERAFPDENPPPVHSVAIMTDSDNTGEEAEACYRNIVLHGASGK